MSLFKQYETDLSAEETGVWAGLGANEDKTEIEILIARSGTANKSYTKAIRKALKPYSRQIEMNLLADELAETIYLKVFAKHCVLGWKNVRDRDGKDIKFSTEAVISILTELPELYAEVTKLSKSALIFKKDSLDVDAKN